MSATFVHEHQTPWVEHSGEGYLPSGSQPLVSLAGTHCPFFSDEPHPLESAAESGSAHHQSSQCFEVLTPLAEFGEGPLLESGFQQSPGTLVYLWAFAWC